MEPGTSKENSVPTTTVLPKTCNNSVNTSNTNSPKKNADKKKDTVNEINASKLNSPYRKPEYQQPVYNNTELLKLPLTRVIREKVLHSIENEPFSSLLNPRHRWLHDLAVIEPDSKNLLVLFISLISATEQQIFLFRETEIMIEKIGKKLFPHAVVRAHAYGSSITRLSLRNSDVDIFLDIAGPNIDHAQLPQILETEMKKNYKRDFYGIRAIQAKVPIVHCERKRSGLQCDISFSNGLGLANTELVSFYLTLDVRIQPLIMFLKFWMRRHVTTHGNVITSYSLSLLVFFMLQQLEAPLVPSVYQLQNATNKKYMIDGWNAAFNVDRRLISETHNHMSVYHLIRSFFDFYSYFDFGLFVVCPLLGKPILKAMFSQPHLLPNEMALYKQNLSLDPENNEFEYRKCMCVQDPFKLSHNVTRNTAKKDFFQFQESCRNSLFVFDAQFTTLGPKVNFLNSIFFPDAIPNGSSRKKRKPIKSKLRYLDVKIPLGSNLIYDNTTELTETNLRNLWGEESQRLLIEILTKVLMCEVTVKPGTSYDMNTNDRFIKNSAKVKRVSSIITCKAKYFVDNGKTKTTHLAQFKPRINARKLFEFPREMSSILKEEMLSHYIVDTCFQNLTPNFINFEINFKLKQDPSLIILELCPVGTIENIKYVYDEYFAYIDLQVPRLMDHMFNSLHREGRGDTPGVATDSTNLNLEVMKE